jgi:hypothetical protein
MTTRNFNALSDPSGNTPAVNLGSDTTYTADFPRGIYVGTSGHVKVDDLVGNTGVLFKNVPAGTTLPIMVKKIYSTANGTTAADLVALR